MNSLKVEAEKVANIKTAMIYENIETRDKIIFNLINMEEFKKEYIFVGMENYNISLPIIIRNLLYDNVSIYNDTIEGSNLKNLCNNNDTILEDIMLYRYFDELSFVIYDISNKEYIENACILSITTYIYCDKRNC